MLTLEEDQEEIFFDSEDYPSELDGNYEIWMKEPRSVQERRQSFLLEMGIGRLVESGAVSAGNCDPICSLRELNGQANCLVEEDSDVNIVHRPTTSTSDCCIIPEECKCKSSTTTTTTTTTSVRGERSLLKNWWKQLVTRTSFKHEEEKVHSRSRIKVSRKKKSRTDLSALYLGQEISAHKGLIWTMKFSPDGKYLASGGEDGLIKIWRVTQATRFMKEIEPSNVARKKTTSRGGGRVVVPDKLFQVEKSPIHEFRGHTGGILDVAWSSSNCLLLSASKDKSVRLWEMGSDECLAIYRHCNYVTCVQFNPLNDNYCVSGSIDGKIRIWDLFERRVVEWADVRDQVTAICYQPDGKGLVVGTLKGFCFHYELSDNGLQLNSQIIRRKKKSSSKKITSIQFPPDDNGRIMITSEDSEVRIVDLDVTHNVEDLVPKTSQRQMSDAFTSDGGHVISARNNSQVYMRKYNDRSSSNSDRLSSCEYFSFHGVSVAVPWRREISQGSSLQKRDGAGGRREVDHLGRFSLGSWFSMEVSTRVSATWPEEKLPVMGGRGHDHDMSAEEQLSETWGLVIVTAGWDGIIRTFHNFGLPTPAPAAANI